jgi:hypothetical protein
MTRIDFKSVSASEVTKGTSVECALVAEVGTPERSHHDDRRI